MFDRHRHHWVKDGSRGRYCKICHISKHDYTRPDLNLVDDDNDRRSSGMMGRMADRMTDGLNDMRDGVRDPQRDRRNAGRNPSDRTQSDGRNTGGNGSSTSNPGIP
ncbi:MAG: hypothetical protein MPK62_01435 [Alphaproteobacteria bacterium]|nr:hypothetical protein [Alphaproteobacteria bacterium]MDA8029797.1 hypothetical protein [Alphaproteobacteria bacterium]